MSFFVSLPSSASKKVFPDNRTGKFSTQLARSVDLSGHWECGLSEIIFPPKKLRLRETVKFFVKKPAQPATTDSPVNALKGGTFINGYELRPRSFDSYADIETALTAIFKRPNNELPDVKFSLTDNVWKLHLKEGIELRVIGQAFCRLIGLQQDFSYNTTEQSVHLFHSYYGIDYVYVYCDVIEHGTIGDAMAPCLRTIPFQPRKDECTIIRFENPHYMPLLKNSFSTIEVELADDLGDEIEFRMGLAIIKLHFRPRKL